MQFIHILKPITNPNTILTLYVIIFTEVRCSVRRTKRPKMRYPTSRDIKNVLLDNEADSRSGQRQI